MTCSTRLLTTADLPAYKALRDAGLRSDPQAFTSDAQDEAARPASSYAQRIGLPPHDDAFIVGAFDARGDLVGAVVCQREPRRKQRHQAALAGMVVAPHARGHGIGQRLMDAFCTHAGHMPGLEQVMLTVTAGNTAAERLYARAGFVRYGLLPRAICVDGVYFDKLHMLLRLPLP